MISAPPTKSPFQTQLAVGNQAMPDPGWIEFFSEVYKGILATQQGGTTAQRPTKNLYPGRFFIDFSLAANGKPIWIGADGATWIDATGATV